MVAVSRDPCYVLPLSLADPGRRRFIVASLPHWLSVGETSPFHSKPLNERYGLLTPVIW